MKGESRLNLSVKKQEQEVEVFDNLDEVIAILTRENKTSRHPTFLWSRVSNEVHRALLYKICEELNLPNPRFIASKYLEKHKFKFLNNSSLNGLYSYYKNRFPRKPGIHIMINVCDQLGIPQVSVEEWIAFISNNNIFSWDNVPNEVKKEILLRACEELGYSHPIHIKNEDFSVKFKFLNGRTLTGFYNHFKSKVEDIRGSVIKNMCDILDIEITEEDWISYITDSSVSTFWDIIPHEVIRNLLYKAAKSLGYTNPRMMSTDDLKTSMDFINGMSFYSFASRFFGLDRGGYKSIDFICDVYGVAELSYDEWIFMISNQKNFKWDMVPKAYINKILFEKAKELGKANPRMLKYDDLATPTAFLNNKTLISLYTYYSGLASKAEMDTITFMCDDCDVPPLTTEEWISIIQEEDIKVPWDNVPKETKKEILIRAAKELGLKNPRFMGYKDFCSNRFSFLNGKTLSGLYSNYSFKADEEQIPVVQYICDDIGIEELTVNDWITMIANCNMCRWESVPLNVQREIVIKAAAEMGIFHPRLMGTKEFDSVELKFLNNKTLAGLYYHYGSKLKDDKQQINEFIFNTLNIPRIDINPKTGRLTTIDNLSHRKYFDSKANIRDFFNRYLKLFSLESLCRKYTMIKNAKKAKIYRKGLITVLASMSKREYIDFVFDILKSVPRDRFGLRKPRGTGDYRLLKSDLYKLAGLEELEAVEENKIEFANVDLVKDRNKEEVIEKLQTYKQILDIKVKKFHKVDCTYLISYKGSYIFMMSVSVMPGEVLTANNGYEFVVVECRERKSNEGYIVELKAMEEIADKEASAINKFTRDSNDNILSFYIDRIIRGIKNDTLSPLLFNALGLKKEKQLSKEDIVQLPDSAYYNKVLLNNPSQKQAVALALSLDGKNNTLAVIQGPPGTGKTTLIKEIALQYYYRGKNVLILAKTNIAVDNILEKLLQDNIRALRTGNNIEFKSDLPYAFTVSTSNPDYMRLMSGKNKIVLGTPMGFYLDRNMDEYDNYDILIIDEASQMDIPETLFSLQFADKAVIIGDHLQIPPFPIQNEVLLEYDPHIDLYTREELQKSLFEELITDKNRYNSVFLDINYRTQNPEMVAFISDLIYDGKLCPNLDSEYYKTPPIKRKKLFPQNPIELIDTSEFFDPQTRMETEVDSTYYNLCEAMLSVRKVISLIKEGEKLSNICIITPYKAHAEKLKEVFENHSKYFYTSIRELREFIERNIYTIDSFQGREQDNIIINWVRSNYTSPGATTRTGFLRDYRRVNVALSRARKRLILIGDFETLTKSENMRVQYIFSKIKNINREERIVL